MGKGMSKAARDNRANQLNPQHSAYSQSRSSSGAPVKMTVEDAQRIQSAADKLGTNQGFKSRVMSAAATNEQDS